jgi:Trypsin-co-occurring domain 1
MACRPGPYDGAITGKRHVKFLSRSRGRTWIGETLITSRRGDSVPLTPIRHLRMKTKRLVEFPLDHGGNVLVEVTDPAVEPVMRGLKDSTVLVQQADRTFEAATAAITPAARSLISRLRSLEEAPDEIGIEFGLQLSAQTGAFIASVAAEANFKISMTWHRAESR